MQVQSAADRFSAQRTAASGLGQVQDGSPVDLTKLAVAQTKAKMTASAGAALAQTTGELTGTLISISV